jgi:hypothetical protein
LNGKQKGAGTYDTSDAAIEAARRADANRPSKTESPAKVQGRLTIAGYMPVFLAGHKMRDATKDSYERQAKHIVRHIGDMLLRELVSATVRTFARTLEASSLAPSYVERIATLLNTMCKTAVADGYMPSNPCETVKAGDKHAQREMRILTKQDFTRSQDGAPALQVAIRVTPTRRTWAGAPAQRARCQQATRKGSSDRPPRTERST